MNFSHNAKVAPGFDTCAHSAQLKISAVVNLSMPGTIQPLLHRFREEPIHDTVGWQIAVFSAQGMSSGDDVLQRIEGKKPQLVVLPSSLPLSKCAYRLGCPVLFVP
jgi:hypothetical protein